MLGSSLHTRLAALRIRWSATLAPSSLRRSTSANDTLVECESGLDDRLGAAWTPPANPTITRAETAAARFLIVMAIFLSSHDAVLRRTRRKKRPITADRQADA